MIDIRLLACALSITTLVSPLLALPSVAQSAAPSAPTKQAEELPLDKPIPVGKLGVSVNVSAVKFKVGPGEQSAWLYKTSGMTALHQPELFVLVLRKKDETETAFPKQPVILLAGLARPSDGGKRFDDLDYIPAASFMGPQFSGFGLVQFDHLAGIDVPNGSLGCVALTPEEFEVWQMAGPARTKAALAYQASYYPTPIWCDRTRTTVFSQIEIEEMKQDPTMRLPRFNSYASALLADKKLSLRISHEEAKLILQTLDRNHGQIRISLTCDAGANAFPVWGSAKNSAHDVVGPNGSDASRLSGEFLIILSGLPADRVRTGMDGFLIELTDASSKKLQTALFNNSDFSLPLTGGTAASFALDWIKTDWKNPMTGQILRTPGGWNTYMPNGKVTTQTPPVNTKKVDVNHVVLLTADSDIRKAIEVKPLADFTNALSNGAISKLERMHPKEPQTIYIQCDLVPERKATFVVGAHHVEPNTGGVIKDVYVALNAVKPPTSKGKVSFQIVIDVPVRP
jgi:hypothetical protein